MDARTARGGGGVADRPLRRLPGTARARPDTEARVLADGLRTHEGFPQDVGDALAFIAAQDTVGYIEAIEEVLESFEARDEYLEDLPVADTVLVLQALADRRDMAAELESPLLPGTRTDDPRTTRAGG